MSTLVGNHTYAVTSGATWATIAQRNPKAQKAGGLCVALNGTPVSPADEVDAAKEYQLVSYGE